MREDVKDRARVREIDREWERDKVRERERRVKWGRGRRFKEE